MFLFFFNYKIFCVFGERYEFLSATVIELTKELNVLKTVGMHVSTKRIDKNVDGMSYDKYYYEEYKSK